MRTYETAFIVNPQAEDSAINANVQAVIDLIGNNGGNILHENRMGTRKLAYPIRKLNQGYFTSLIFEAETDILPKLERHYRLEEPILRYLTIIYEGDLSKLTEEDQPESTEETRTEKPRSSTPDQVVGRREEKSGESSEETAEAAESEKAEDETKEESSESPEEKAEEPDNQDEEDVL